MSENSDDKPKPEEPKPDVIPGFVISRASDGTYTMNARGESPWYITSFEDAYQAQQWVLEYLTTNIANSNRIHVEAQERHHERELESREELAKAMLASEAAVREMKKAKKTKETPN